MYNEDYIKAMFDAKCCIKLMSILWAQEVLFRQVALRLPGLPLTPLSEFGGGRTQDQDEVTYRAPMCSRKPQVRLSYM
jgi:hypothetical protein